MYNNIGKTSFDFPRSLTTTLKTFPIRLDTPARWLLVFVNFRAYGTLPLRPKGDFWRSPDFKRGKYSFFLHHPLYAMLCRCTSYLKKTANALTLNGGDRGGVWILLFFEVSLFEYYVSTILSPIVRSDSRWHFEWSLTRGSTVRDCSLSPLPRYNQ